MKKIKVLLSTSLFALSLQATHIVYIDMSYKNIRGNTYEFTLTFYMDCSTGTAPATAYINYCSPSCNFQPGSIVCTPINGTGQPVFPICSYPNSTCINQLYPGFRKYVYKGSVTLPGVCTDWTFTYNVCCRQAIVNTISNPL